MVRGLIYPPPQPTRASVDATPTVNGRQTTSDAHGTPRAAERPDSFREKLLKYIPGEVVAFYVPATALAGPDETAILWMALAAGTTAAPMYLALASREIDRVSRPRWWSYALAIIAFLAWALATSSATADLLGIDQKLAGMILAVAALFIPALDLLLTPCSTRRRARRRARTQPA